MEPEDIVAMHDDANSSVALDSHMLTPLSFAVDEQRITFHRVDFVTKSLYLTTELDVRVHFGYPGSSLGAIGLNCRQAAILGVRVNGEATNSFSFADPWTLTDGISEEGGGDEPPPSDIDSLNRRMAMATESTDTEHQNGELWITNLTRGSADQQLTDIIASGDPDSSEVEDATLQLEWVSLTIAIDYAIEHPESGLVFVIPRHSSRDTSNDTLIQRGAHVYTTSTTSARDWLPCVDSPNACCKWKIEFHLPPSLTAVSCGEHSERESELSTDRIHAFSLSFPVPAFLIGFAIGGFQHVTDENMNEIQHFCLPGGISNLLEPTTNCLQSVFEFFEENLNCPYPFPAYRQIYVYSPPREVISYASFSILSSATLTSANSIEGQITTRKLHSEAIARQYFGCVVLAESSPSSMTSRLSPSWWLVPALARYVASLYNRKAFGSNEDKSWVADENTILADFEVSRLHGNALRLDVESTAFEIEPFSEMVIRKGALILRLVELKITYERLLHVLSVLLTKSVKREMSILTHSDFVQNVANISGTQVVEFMARFEASASIRLSCRYVYSRRRSALQVTLAQQNSLTMYAGPVSIAIQETDQHASHVVQMSGKTVNVELPIHSKPKKTRKRHVVLSSGESIDIELPVADIDCIMLWLQVDPNYSLLRASTIIEQPDYGWQFQLELDRNVCGQLDAVRALKQYPTPATRARLESAILNDQFFYRVRCEASKTLADNLIVTAQNTTAASGGIVTPVSAQPLIVMFKKLFSSRSSSHLPKPNNFSNIQSYLVQSAMVEAIASCAAKDGLDFLLSLLTFNDNSRNKFSDAYYVANMCRQLAYSVPAAPTRMVLSDTATGNLNLGSTTPPGMVLTELVTRLNIDTLPSPTPGFVVSRACLAGLRLLQKRGHLPNNAKFFEAYIGFGNSKIRKGSAFCELREEAFRCFIEAIAGSDDTQEEAVADEYSEAVVELALKDEDLSVRFYVLDYLFSISMKKRNSKTRSMLARLLPKNLLWDSVLLANDIRIRSRLAAIFEAIHGDGNQANPAGHDASSISPAAPLKKLKKEKLSIHPPFESSEQLEPHSGRSIFSYDDDMHIDTGNIF